MIPARALAVRGESRVARQSALPCSKESDGGTAEAAFLAVEHGTPSSTPRRGGARSRSSDFRHGLLIPALLAALLCAACISRAPAGQVRFFEPPAGTTTDAEPALQPTSALHLLRVSAPAHLGRPMVWRRSEVELVFDEQNRWAAEPAAQLEEALRRALFVRGPYVPREGRGAARLEVRLTEYEGHLGRRPLARAALTATISTDERARSRRFSASTPLPRTGPEALAQGLGAALDDALAQLVAWLAGELAP